MYFGIIQEKILKKNDDNQFKENALDLNNK